MIHFWSRILNIKHISLNSGIYLWKVLAKLSDSLWVSWWIVHSQSQPPSRRPYSLRDTMETEPTQVCKGPSRRPFLWDGFRPFPVKSSPSLREGSPGINKQCWIKKQCWPSGLSLGNNKDNCFSSHSFMLGINHNTIKWNWYSYFRLCQLVSEWWKDGLSTCSW